MNLETLMENMPRPLQVFFNTSKMFPGWENATQEDDLSYNPNQFIREHLGKCYFQAAILDEWVAEAVYLNFSAKRKPVFLGKNIVHELFLGYRLFGHVDNITIMRVRHISQTGIFQCWRTTVKHLVRLHTYTKHFKQGLDEQVETSNYYLLVLGSIVGFCVTLAFIALITEMCMKMGDRAGNYFIPGVKMVYRALEALMDAMSKVYWRCRYNWLLLRESCKHYWELCCTIN